MAPLAASSQPSHALRLAGRPRRAWLALLGWALLTLGAPAVTGAQLLERAGASDDGAGLVWASDDAVEPAAIPARDQRFADPALPPVHELPAPVIPAVRAASNAPSSPGADAPACRGVARWCLAHATSTSLS